MAVVYLFIYLFICLFCVWCVAIGVKYCLFFMFCVYAFPCTVNSPFFTNDTLFDSCLSFISVRLSPMHLMREGKHTKSKQKIQKLSNTQTMTSNAKCHERKQKIKKLVMPKTNFWST